MADRSAVDEIREALEWMRRHAAYMGGPGHVTDRDDAAALAARALGRLAELATCDRCAHPIDAPGEPRASRLCGPCVEADEGAAHRLEFRLGTIRMYLENPKTVDPSVCAATCDVFRAVVRAVAEAERRGYERCTADVSVGLDVSANGEGDGSHPIWLDKANRLAAIGAANRSTASPCVCGHPHAHPHGYCDHACSCGPGCGPLCPEAAKGLG